MELVTVKHRGATIQLPHDMVVQNWMDSIARTSDTIAGSCRASNESLAIPQLGEYWHGQGGIYAARMRGNKGQPDRHVVVPVADGLDFKSEWGCRGVEIKGADNDLYGMPNTAAMAEAGSDLAKKILGMKIEGHCDFYLGARHEYRACYLSVPELFKKEWYWTSTQHGAHHAFVQYFSDGNQGYGNETSRYYVRPVRSFVI